MKPKPAVTDRPPVARPYTRREEALVFYEEGMAAVRERRPVPAAVAFGSAVKKDPEFGRAWLRLGQISLRGGNRSASERAYLEALRNSGDLDPREVELADIGLAASRGEMERTRQLVEQFQMAHPGDDEIRPYVKGLREAERSSDGPRHPGFRRRGRRN